MSVRKNAATAESRANPYPGLRPFGESDARWFFGRSEETRELLDRLTLNRFVAVLGSSGCGKSSLVRAGVIPTLRAGYDSAVPGAWLIATLRPGGDPIGNLAEALSQTLHPRARKPQKWTEQIIAELRKSPAGMESVVRSAKIGEGVRLLVLVDQFEELFTIAASNAALPPGDVRDFVHLLIEAVWTPGCPVHVVVTMRSENLGLCSRYTDLSRAINDGLFLVPRLRARRLRDVIELPVDHDIDPGVVTCLLNDVDGRTDELPLLQHALMRLWEARDARDPDSPISLDDLDRVGGLGESLGRQIEEEILGPILEEGSPGDIEVVYDLFLEITGVGNDGQMNRHPRRYDDLLERIGCADHLLRSIIDRFRAEGRCFLRPTAAESPAIEDDDMIDISHESLIRQWDELCIRAVERKALLDEIELVELLAEDFVRRGRDPAALEADGPRLGKAINLLKLRPRDFTEAGREFVELSRLRAKAIRTKARVLRSIAWSIPAVLFAIIIFAGFKIAIDAREREEVKKENAEAMAKVALATAESERAEREKAEALAKAESERAEREGAEKEKAEAMAKAESERAEREKAEKERAEALKIAAEKEALRLTENERNQKLLRELNLAQQQERAETQAKLHRNQEALRTLVGISYETLLENREYRDAAQQVRGFPGDGQVVYLGQSLTRDQIEKCVAFESGTWPIRRFTLLADPEVIVGDNLETAEVTAYFHYEFRTDPEDKTEGGARDRRAAGFFREVSNYRIGENSRPVLTSLNRDPAAHGDLVAQIERGNPKPDNLTSGDATASIERYAKNCYWLRGLQLSGESGTVVSAPVIEVVDSERIVARGEVYRSGPGSATGEAAGWLECRIEVNSRSYEVRPVEGNPSRSAGEPPLPREPPLLPPATGAARGSDEGRGFPWPPSLEYVERNQDTSSRDRVCLNVIENWKVRGAGVSAADVARASGELYIISSNPNPIIEQIEFFSQEGGETKLRDYYGTDDPSFEKVKTSLDDYTLKRPERGFLVDSVEVINGPEAPETRSDELAVLVRFQYRESPAFQWDQRAIHITFLIRAGMMPVVTAVNNAGK